MATRLGLFLVVVGALFVVGSGVGAGIFVEEIILRRGDVNLDGSVNISDPAFLSNYLFAQGPEPGCLNQADANDDGAVNVADMTFLFNYLAGSGSAPPYPGPSGVGYCVVDPLPRPGCTVDPCD